MASVAISAENLTKEWSTIDWVHQSESAEQDRMVQRTRILRNDVKQVIAQSQGWVSAVLAGIIIGIIVVVFETINHFVTSFRLGVCENYFWLEKSLCCAYKGENADCPEWNSWGELFGGANGAHTAIANYFFFVLWACIFTAVASLFCKVYGPFAVGGGINEVKTIVSGSIVSRYLGAWTLVTKVIGVGISTGSGLIAGKEGPFVHIGACSADLIATLFPAYRNDSKRRELIAAGAGGGFGVAFGAPIGGVLFAIEEITAFSNFKTMLKALLCGVAGVLVVKNVDMWHTGKIVQYGINYRFTWHWFELLFHVVLGLACGLFAAAFSSFNLKWCKQRSRSFLQRWKVTEVVILTFISASLHYLLPYSQTGFVQSIQNLFMDCQSSTVNELCDTNDFKVMTWLLVLGCVNLALAIITIGSCIPAGFIGPMLLIGATFGRAYGILIQSIQSYASSAFIFEECLGLSRCIVPGTYAVVGGAAVLGGCTRMTVCLVVVMSELTGGVECIVPVALGIVAARWVGEELGVGSIFEMGIEAANLPYLDPKKEFPYAYSAEDINQGRTFNCITTTGWSVEDLSNLLETTPYRGFPLVQSSDDRTIIGYISHTGLFHALRDQALSNHAHFTSRTMVRFRSRSGDEPHPPNELDCTGYVEPIPIQVEPDCSISRLLYLFKSLGSRMIMITRFSKFEGLITKKDLLAFMRKIEQEEQEEEKELTKPKKEE